MKEKWLEYDTIFKSKLDRVINNSVGQRIECEVVRQLSVKSLRQDLNVRQDLNERLRIPSVLK